MAASVFCPGEPAVVRGAAFPVWLERVETFSIARGVAEIRIHHVSTFGRRRVRDGGFAIADDRPLEVESGDDWCLVHRHDGLVSGIFALHGFGSADATRRTGANAFGRYSAAPYLVSREEIPAEGVCASLVVLAEDDFDPHEARAAIEEFEVRGREVGIGCIDGERFFVQLVAPEPVEATLGHLELSGPVRYARISPDGTEFVLRT
jgi:hypothetical protein